MVTPPFRAREHPAQDIPSGRRHLRTGCLPCRRPMVAAPTQFSSAAFQANAVLQTACLDVLAPRPEGRGYHNVRLSGESCLSGECRSPYTGYLGGSAKRLLFVKSFCNSLFFSAMMASHGQRHHISDNLLGIPCKLSV